jgi:putative FmdB family regulatory protein
MPYYVFVCRDCKKDFTEHLHMSDLDKGGIKCPHCGSEKVDQKYTEFAAVTSKKS